MKKWIDYYNEGRLKLDLEISTQCNAYCPQCMRYESYSEGNDFITTDKRAWYNSNAKWDFEKFKTLLTEEDIRAVEYIQFSGAEGDPCTVKELPEIVQYIRETNPHTFITINTNGSMQTDDWWWELGLAGGKMCEILFAVDGIDQETHSYYRRNTNLEKIISNMETISNTNCRVCIGTVVFEHNKNQIEAIAELGKKFNMKYHDVAESNRFFMGPSTYFYEDGVRYELEQVRPVQLLVESVVPTDDRLILNPTRDTRDHRNASDIESITSITCEWNEMQKVTIRQDGRVVPCCYIAHDTVVEDPNKPLPELMRDFKDLNVVGLNNKSLKEILSSEIYTNKLFKSFENKETQFATCKFVCGKCD